MSVVWERRRKRFNRLDTNNGAYTIHCQGKYSVVVFWEDQGIHELAAALLERIVAFRAQYGLDPQSEKKQSKTHGATVLTQRLTLRLTIGP